MTKQDNRKFNWLGIVIIFGTAFMMSLIGLSLPDTINKLNGLDQGSLYGVWVSYVTAILLFWIITSDIKLTRKIKNDTTR